MIWPAATRWPGLTSGGCVATSTCAYTVEKLDACAIMTMFAVSPYDMYGWPATWTTPACVARIGVYIGAAMSSPLWNPPSRAPKYDEIVPSTGQFARRGADAGSGSGAGTTVSLEGCA